MVSSVRSSVMASPVELWNPIRVRFGFYNDKPYSFVSGGSGKSGVYPYAEWSFRLSGVYQLPAEFSVGAFARYQQGYPYVFIGQTTDQSFSAFDGTFRTLLLEPVGDRRYDNIFTLDLNVQKVLNFGNAGRRYAVWPTCSTLRTTTLLFRETVWRTRVPLTQSRRTFLLAHCVLVSGIASQHSMAPSYREGWGDPCGSPPFCVY